MQRRMLLKFAAMSVAAASVGAAVPVLAADLPYDDKGDPFDFILKLSNAVLDKIRSDASIKSGDIEAIRILVDDLIMPAVDFKMMTRMTVGPKWRTATPEQQTALQDGFETLLMRVYSGALSTVSDQVVELRPTRSRVVRDEMVIRTLMKGKDQPQPTSLDYRIYRDKAGSWKIVDVNIEGIWMVENYRSQFASVLNQDGVEGLIKLFSEKGEALAKGIQESAPGKK